MAQTAPQPAPDAPGERARTLNPLMPAEEFAHYWAHEASLDAVLVELDHELRGRGEPAPEVWREADLDPEVAGAAWAVARRMLRANDSERAEVRALARVCFRHGVGAMLAGALPRENARRFAGVAAAKPAGPGPALETLVAKYAGFSGEQTLVRGVAEAVAHPLSNAERVALAVANDRILASLVLRLVNSEFFGLDAPIRSLERAVTFVGFGEMQALALAVAAIRALAPHRDGRLERAWRRGMTCGVAARLIAKRLHLSGKWLLAAGLLHVVGELVLEREAPRRAGMARALADREGVPLDRAQRRLLGYDAAELGNGLLEAWQLSGQAADLVGNRHQPHLAERPDQAAVFHLAGILAHILDLSDNGRIPAPVLDRQAWCGLCLPVSSLPALAEAVLGERFSLLRAVRR